MAHRVRELRLATPLTQRALAARLGVEPIQVRLWEHGSPLPARYRVRLAALFGVTEAFLLREEAN